jgi:2-oxoglutarate ferredoxin oxidoreductase subunit delta
LQCARTIWSALELCSVFEGGQRGIPPSREKQKTRPGWGTRQEMKGQQMTTTNQPTAKRDRGTIAIDEQECKGCGLCNEACPPHVIGMSDKFNHYGYRTAAYAGAGCTGCGVCFMVCPEPGAITVYVLDNAVSPAVAAAASAA